MEHSGMSLTVRQKIVRRLTRMLMPFRYETEDVTTCWCGGSLGPSRSPLVGECVECGTGVLRRRLTEESYERWYATGDYRRCQMGTVGVSVAQGIKEIRRAEAAFRLLSDHGLDIYGKSVLDVGCGAGGALIVAKLLRAGMLLGVDSDPRSQEVPRALGIQVIESMPVANDWDRIICSHLIEHIIRPVAFLQMLARYLSDEGCLYIETPAWGPKAEIKLPHPFMYSEESFRLLAKRAYVEILRMESGLRAVLKRVG